MLKDVAIRRHGSDDIPAWLWRGNVIPLKAIEAKTRCQHFVVLSFFWRFISDIKPTPMNFTHHSIRRSTKANCLQNQDELITLSENIYLGKSCSLFLSP